MTASVFFEFNLPNAATWFYMSLFLAVGLFFKFGRLFSLRNWDLLALFLMVPGLLLLQEGQSELSRLGPPNGELSRDRAAESGHRLVFVGYVWLLAGSAYWLLRCLIDLPLSRRDPAPRPNLDVGGLAWFGAALLIGLTAVAFREQETATPGRVGRTPVAMERAQDRAAAVVSFAAGRPGRRGEARYWVGRSAALLCHAAVVAGLVLIGKLHFRDAALGVGAAALYLILPYTAYHVAQLHHVWPVTLVVWALACYRRPGLAGGLIGVTAGFSFFPLLLVPAWVGFYRGSGAWEFAKGFLFAFGVSVGLTGAVLLYDGDFAAAVRFTLSLSDWQPWKIPDTPSIWSGSHWAYRIPVFIAYSILLTLTALWPTPKNFGHLIALSAALLIGVQFWYADRGGVYVLWYQPLLILMVFRPNLAEVFAPAVPSRRPVALPEVTGGG